MKKVYLAKILCVLTVLFAMVTNISQAAPFNPKKNITVVTREDGSGTKSAFMEIIKLKGKSDVSGVIIATGTAGVLAEVKNNPLAIAYESLGYVTGDVKKLKVDGAEATIDNIQSGAYKIARPLNVLYKKSNLDSNKVVSEYLKFLQSDLAKTVIDAEGYVSTNNNVVTYAPLDDAGNLQGEVKISGSTSLQPLMIKLATEFEKIYPKVRVTVSGGGSGTGYQNGENGTSDFGMISEAYNSQKAPNCDCYEVAKDGIAIIVNKNNTYDDISLDDLQNIYNVDADPATKITKWADISK